MLAAGMLLQLALLLWHLTVCLGKLHSHCGSLGALLQLSDQLPAQKHGLLESHCQSQHLSRVQHPALQYTKMTVLPHVTATYHIHRRCEDAPVHYLITGC